MSSSTSRPTVLVFNAGSRQGSALVSALRARTTNFNIVGTSRSADNPRLLAQGVSRVLPFRYNDPQSVAAALKAATAGPDGSSESQQPLHAVWFNTLPPPTPSLWNLFGLAGSSHRQQEAEAGRMIVDACAELGPGLAPKHVVFSSVADCDRAGEEVTHFKAKLDVEDHLKKVDSFPWSILRPVAFFDDQDNASQKNPLTKGSVKALFPADLRVKQVAIKDVGKAAARIIDEGPSKWGNTTLDCAAEEISGNGLAEALTKTSGTESKYKVALPTFLQRVFVNDLYHMVKYFETDGYSSSVETFKKAVPDCLDAEGWYREKGQWADGEKFTGS